MRPFLTHPVINLILFQFGWFTCVLGASYRYFELSLIIMLAIWLLHLWASQNRTQDLQLILTGGCIGIVNETILYLLNIYEPQRWLISEPISPFWLVCLWMNVGITLNGCLGWLKPRLAIAALLAAGGGPLAFLAGERLGALSMNPPVFFSLFILAVFWAIVFPLFVWIAKRMNVNNSSTNNSHSR